MWKLGSYNADGRGQWGGSEKYLFLWTSFMDDLKLRE